MQTTQLIQIINKYSNKYLPDKLSRIIEKYLTPEFVRYLLVGTTSVLLMIIFSNIGFWLWGNSFLGVATGWTVTAVFGYYAHMLFTFNVTMQHKTYLPGYIALILGSLFYATTMTMILYEWLFIPYFITSTIIAITWPLISYLTMKFYIFNNNPGGKQMESPINLNDLINIYPKTRPALPQKFQDVYVVHYKSNRSDDLSINSIGARLERWMHNQVATPLQEQKDIRILELGAGNLNHVRYENNYSVYDVVEPFVELFEASSQTVDKRYDGVFDIDENNKYDKICSIAVLEHLEELPYIIAKSALLMDNNAVFNFGIPSEGTILWKLGSDYTTGISFKKRYNLDYAYLQRYDHINTALEIEHVCNLLFNDVQCKVFGLNRGLSLYQYFECRQPNLELCQQLLQHYNKLQENKD